jgi:DNA-binding SARP family transcriptional activator
MIKGGTSPGPLVESQGRWRTAGELLKAGQYEQVTELLHEAQAASEGRGDAILAHVLAVASRICLACRQCQAEIEWHRRGYEQADQREQELRQQLHTILDLIGGREALETPDKREELPGASPVEMSPPELGAPEPVARLSLPGRRPPPQLPTRATPVTSVKVSATPSPDRTEVLVTPPDEKGRREKKAPPSLAVYCLGPFRVYQDDRLIADWPSGKGKCIFKYMIAKRGRPIPKDILMDLFWRDANPEAARNNLNVAIYGLRQAFRAVRPDFAHILFQNDCYLLNPAMAVWVDVEEFEQRYGAGQSFERRGRLAEAMGEYEVAEGLYQGDFLEEDLYEDCLIPRREGLKDSYLVVLDRLSRYYLEEKRYVACIHVCQKILAKDDCREDAHRRLTVSSVRGGPGPGAGRVPDAGDRGPVPPHSQWRGGLRPDGR